MPKPGHEHVASGFGRRQQFRVDYPSEKRTSPRRRVLKAGRIVFNGGRSTIDCRVRSLSASGALLVMESSIGIPDEFELQIISDAAVRQVKVVRRAISEIAVTFTDGPREPG
jgi:hypothetical protein